MMAGSSMRQQFADVAGRLGREARKDVFQVRGDIVPIEPGRVYEAHHRRGAFSGARTSWE
jgi:hypothetical protein